MRQLDQEIEELYHVNMCRNLYCIKCDFFKPMRARHCRVCNRCVLRFDHHCPWTGNCIGRANMKVFVQFLFHTGFFLVFFSLVQLISYFIVLRDCVFVDDAAQVDPLIALSKIYISDWEHTLFKTMGIAALVVGTSVVYLFAYQVKNLEKNITTVEHQIVKDRDYSPFDSGCVRCVFALANLQKQYG